MRRTQRAPTRPDSGGHGHGAGSTPQPRWQERSKPQSRCRTLGRGELRRGAEAAPPQSGRLGPFLPRRERRAASAGFSGAAAAPPLTGGSARTCPTWLLQSRRDFPPSPARKLCGRSPQARYRGAPAAVSSPTAPACAAGPLLPAPSPPRPAARRGCLPAPRPLAAPPVRPRRCCGVSGGSDGSRVPLVLPADRQRRVGGDRRRLGSPSTAAPRSRRASLRRLPAAASCCTLCSSGQSRPPQTCCTELRQANKQCRGADFISDYNRFGRYMRTL